MHRRSLALLGPLLLAACGPTDTEIAGAVLMYAPIVYLAAMLIVSVLFEVWRTIRPDLRFGRGSHVVALALLAGPAIYGMQHADAELIGLVLLFFGACVLACWLVLARLTLRSGWGFRWGGLVVTGLLIAPVLVGMLQRELFLDMLQPMVLVYMSGGGLGVMPVFLLIVMLIEGARAGRSVRAVGSGKDGAT